MIIELTFLQSQRVVKNIERHFYPDDHILFLFLLHFGANMLQIVNKCVECLIDQYCLANIGFIFPGFINTDRILADNTDNDRERMIFNACIFCLAFDRFITFTDFDSIYPVGAERVCFLIVADILTSAVLTK